MTSSPKPRVLFLCTGNSARSQMAEGLLRHLGGAEYEALSAGTNPAGLHSLAVEAMRELGVDISAQRSKSIDEFAGEKLAAVITVCDAAAQNCPFFPGSGRRLHWSVPDPAAAAGGREEKLHVFRSVRDELQARIRHFLNAEQATQIRESRVAR